MKTTVKVITLAILLSFSSVAQNVGINTAGTSPDDAAMLDVESTEQGILIPRMSDAQRKLLKDPAAGLIIYNTTNEEFNFYNGTGWLLIPTHQVSTMSSTGTGPGLGVAVNTTGNAPDPSSIMDVSSTEKGFLLPRTTQGAVTPVTGLIIYNTATNNINYYDGTSWVSLCHQLIDNNTGTGATAGGISINSTGAVADPSAILDVSSSTKGVLIPRMTSTQRDNIKTPAQSLTIYNTTQNRIESWIDAAWYQWGVPTPTGVTASASPNPICEGSDLSLSGSATGATTWSWTGPNGFSSSSQNPTISTITSAEAGVYTLTATNACGSATASTTSVTVNTLPSVSAGSNQSICAGESTSLSASGASSYSWDNGAGSGASPSVSPSSTTTYTVTGTDVNGCENTDQVTVTVTSCWTCGDDFTDSRDGKTYSTVQIGNQCWMAENLNYDAGSNSWCYDNNSSNCNTYGRLYTWDEASGGSSSNSNPSGVQGVCPTGWHLPSDDEWCEMENTVETGTDPSCNQTGYRGTNTGKYLKTSSWGGDNNSGFTALPGGYRSVSGTAFFFMGSSGVWWSATEENGSNARTRYLHQGNSGAMRSTNGKVSGIPVRCVRD